MKTKAEIKPKQKDIKDKNRGVQIVGLNQGVLIVSDYHKDTLERLTKYALNMYRAVIKIDKEEKE